jgi:hypothetical protein
MPKRWARCQRVVEGIPYVAEAFVKLMLCDRSASSADSMSLGVHVFGPLLFFESLVGVFAAVDVATMLLPSVMYCRWCPMLPLLPLCSECIFESSLVSE